MNRQLAILLLIAQSVTATDWYVDSGASGTRDGTSWANAWTNITDLAGVSAGDTVYLSGGSAGQKKYYYPSYYGIAGIWVPQSGTEGSPITYKIGQDTGHKEGTAFFVGNNTNSFLGYNGSPHDIIISGDAGDGQMHFAITNYPGAGALDGWRRFRICYINFGEAAGLGCGDTAADFEIDHTWVKKVVFNGNETHRFSTPVGTAMGNSSYHHNVSHSPQMESGYGDDNIVIVGGGGIDIYENTLIGYTQTNGSTFQHPDGIFSGGANNIRVWNNTLIDIADYGIYWAILTEAQVVVHDLHFWNNKFVNCLAGVMVGTDQSGAGSWYSNVFVFNNTVDNATWPDMQNNGIGGGAGAANTLVTNAFYANNLCIGGASANGGLVISPEVGAGLTTNANLWIAPAQAATNLTAYTTTNSNTRASTNSNLMPLSTASSIVGQGTNLNSFFTTDILGTVRGASWDIGAYEYQAPTVSNRNIRATTLRVGTIR